MSSDSSDDEISKVSTTNQNVSKTKRGITLRLNEDDEIPNSSIYTSKVYDYIECQDNADSKEYLEKVVRSNDDELKDEDGNILMPGERSRKVVCQSQSESEGECEDVATISSSSQRSSMSPAPPSPPLSMKASLPRKVRRRLRCGMKEVMDNLEKAYRKSNKKNNDLESENLSDEVLCDDDIETSDKIHLLIQYNSVVSKYTLNKGEKFHRLISNLAGENNVEFNEILLTHEDKEIAADESPSSLNITVADIIECYVIRRNSEDDKNTIEIQIQSNSRRKSTYRHNKYQPLSKLLKRYADENKLSFAELKLKFDGDIVDFSKSPEDLEMENGDCLDVVVRGLVKS